jgi:transposase
MPTPTLSDPKLKALREQGMLNPSPEDVKDPLFLEDGFFDPYDLLQVRYEMLRRVSTEKSQIGPVAAAFGVSRVTFYQILKRFREEGMAGLFPRLRGPKAAHKLTEKVMVLLETALANDPSLRPQALAELVKEELDLSVHPRSIERALARRQKKRPK